MKALLFSATDAFFEGMKPRFPPEANLLNLAYLVSYPTEKRRDAILCGGFWFNQIEHNTMVWKGSDGVVSSPDRNPTSDGYVWAISYFLTTKDGLEIHVKFPKVVTDRNLSPVRLERSIAFYASEKVSDNTLRVLALKLLLAHCLFTPLHDFFNIFVREVDCGEYGKVYSWIPTEEQLLLALNNY